jgi:hypothetical protein
MGQIVVNVGSFDLTSHNGNTAYSTTRYFDIPANAGITACVATFATHVNTGNFQGKSFSLNGTQAHPNTPWPTSGISLNTALLSTGQNTFRAAVKSQAGLSARWSIGDIYLTIDYIDASGGGTPPNIGTITLDKSSMLAGETVTVNLSPCDNGIYRSIRVKWQGVLITSLIAGGDVPSGATYTYTFPLADCSRMPNDTSGSLTFEMETSVDITVTRTMIIQVPDSVVPTIGTFTATRDANGVDASITKYVQNYSKCNLLIDSVAGALGSSIQSYEITGAGFSAAASSVAFGPFAQAGDITFTAKVTDSRGRTATRTVTINVLSYGPAAFSNPEAWRSSDVGVKNQKGTYARLKSGVIYSSLDGQNAVTLKGRVYIKGGTSPSWTSMTPGTAWITGGGLLLITKTYIAQMLVEDLISARIVEFTIPTKKTGISIMAGMAGIAFGKSAEIPGVAESEWPVYAESKLVLTEDYKNEGTGYSTDSGFIINFKIPASSAQNDWIFAEIVGGRDGDKPIFSQIQVNKYNTTWRSPIQKNYAYALPAAKFMELGGYIQLYIPTSPGVLVVTVRSNNNTGRNPAPLVQAAASEPSGTNKVTCAIV